LKDVPRKEDYEKLQKIPSNKQYDKPKEASVASRQLQIKGKASQGVDQQVTQVWNNTLMLLKENRYFQA